MKITNHLVEDAAQHLIPGGAVMAIRRFLVIHHTAGATGQSSIDFWRRLGNGVCAHIVIERDGTILQCRPFNRTAGHAGSSSWVDPQTGIRYHGLNACSIGIELANAGSSPGALQWAQRFPAHKFINARHRDGGPERTWETYPAAQLAACQTLAQALVSHYNLDDLIGHEDCSPGRKTDPGPAFPMSDLRAACGFPRTTL